LIVWLALLYTCMAQTAPTVQEDVVYDTVYRYHPSEHKEISLDLIIGANPPWSHDQKAWWLYPSPTLIEMKEISKGEKYAKVYVNADILTVICNGITPANRDDYTAFKETASEQILHEPGPQANQLSIYVDDFNAPSLGPDAINNEKRWLYKRNFCYFVKNKAGKVVASLTIAFVFPRPAPMLIEINEKQIKEMKDRPVETSIYIPGYREKNKEELAQANKAASKANDTSDIPSRLVLRPGIRTVLFQFKTLREDNFLEYRLGNGEWKTTAKGEYPFFILEDLQPGNYKLQVRYPLQKSIFEYEFEIEPAFVQTTAFKVIAGVLLTAILGVLLFLMYSARQKSRLKEEVNKRTQLQHQITYLQSQLQPHFIFNALNSIQGLINKRNIEDANIYISKFGALLHEVIGKNDKTMQPLATELKQVEYYLQLEQLRFKFQYKIAVAANVNTTEINIPTMLLQPFVENAIKHGIVEKKEAGEIEVAINRDNNDLHIEIKDNGKGYDINSANTGRGNAMVEERVQALNSLLKDQTITLTTRSIIQEGTVVSINFSNWF